MQIYTLDLDFQGIPQAIAAYLVRGPGGVVLVETGPYSTLPALQAHLQDHGLAPGDLAAAIVTHIHLDHAGAAGWLTQQGVPLYVHPVGAPHLLDPSRLWASATRIYGDQMEPLWGTIVPAAPERVFSLEDGEAFTVAGLTFRVLDTPGHASHHHVIRLADVAFTGDIAGVRMPGETWVDVPGPPPEFDPVAWRSSLARLRRERVARLFPTHFGAVTQVEAHLDLLSASLEAVAAFIGLRVAEGLDRDMVAADYAAWVRQFAVGLGVAPAQFDQYAAANPHFMTVDGVMRYWRKRFV
jgi:glyoxylase-like metal-dependent hydrolase (beta-lactamase superfamily II)